jgi:hypothetical protein
METARISPILPYIKKMKFGNVSIDNLELGDILYFNYSGSNRQDTILNPCIIFGGYDKRNGTITGANIRNFYTDKVLSTANSFLHQYQSTYWDEKVEEDSQDTSLVKNKISYTSTSAFRYENIKTYNSCNVMKVINNNRVKINLLKQYWRSYTPNKMFVGSDSFSTLTQNNILINIDVARVIINTAPRTLVIQRGIL